MVKSHFNHNKPLQFYYHHGTAMKLQLQIINFPHLLYLSLSCRRKCVYYDNQVNETQYKKKIDISFHLLSINQHLLLMWHNDNSNFLYQKGRNNVHCILCQLKSIKKIVAVSIFISHPVKDTENNKAVQMPGHIHCF